MFALLLGLEEDLAATAFLIGAYLIFTGIDKRKGQLTCLLSVLYFFACIALQNYFRQFCIPEDKLAMLDSHFLHKLEYIYVNLSENAKSGWLRYNSRPIRYSLAAFSGSLFAFVPGLISDVSVRREVRFLILAAVPSLLTGLLASMHHAATMIPLLMIAAGISLNNLRRTARGLALACCAVAVIFSLKKEMHHYRFPAEKSLKIGELQKLNTMLPRDSNLTYKLEYPHDPFILFRRPNIWTYPYLLAKSDYFLIDKELISTEPKVSVGGRQYEAVPSDELQELVRSGEYRVVYEGVYFKIFSRQGRLAGAAAPVLPHPI